MFRSDSNGNICWGGKSEDSFKVAFQNLQSQVAELNKIVLAQNEEIRDLRGLYKEYREDD